MAQDDPIVAVLDTSALYGSKNRRRLVALALQGAFVGVWSPHIIGELYRVLTERWTEKRGHSAASHDELSRSSKAMMEVLLAALVLQDTGPRDDKNIDENLKDSDDFHLLVAARRAHAAYIVSENTHDFPERDADGKCVLRRP